MRTDLPNPMIAALFDIEGTLFTNPMGKGMTKYAFSNGRRLAGRRLLCVAHAAVSDSPS